MLRLISLFLSILLKRSPDVLWFSTGLFSKCSDFQRLKMDLRRMFVEMTMSYLSNKDQQDALFFLNLFQ